MSNWLKRCQDVRAAYLYLLNLWPQCWRKPKYTSVRMMIPKIAKNAMTIRKDMLVLSLEPHVPFLLRFFELPELLLFFKGSISTLIYAIFLAIDFFLSQDLLVGLLHGIYVCYLLIDLPIT